MVEEFKFYKETYNGRWGKRVYEVSNFGRVKCNGKLFKCTIVHGYYYLCQVPLHRIVAELFLPNWDPNLEVDHKDCNPLNNRVDNLLVCNHKQNMNNPLSIQHQKPKSVLQYTKDNKFVAEYVSTREAGRQTKISQSNIVACCNHKYGYKSAGGFIWEYKN